MAILRSVTIEAFAKINLTLRVIGKRPDGFHEIRTVLQTIDLADRIVCRARPGPLQLRCSAAGIPEDRTNLVWRAAEALWQADGRSGPARDLDISVTKRIPTRAGLGGGSSDAAATLIALARLWNLNIRHQALAEISATLGSDVPFFLWGGAALGIGRGDEIYPLADLPRWWALILIPPFGISTADAYQWKAAEPPNAQSETASPVAAAWLGRLSMLGNDLEPVVGRRHPEITEAVALLRDEGASLAAMSGSGSAVFGLFREGRTVNAVRRRLSRGLGWNTRIARLLPRAEFVRRTRPVLAAPSGSRIN